MLLCCCGFALLFFMLWYNVPLIFNHFTCYLSISRDQLSSVFSWSLTYLARALVMFLFFFFPCVTIMLHHTKFRLVPLLCTTCEVMVASKILLLLSSAHATVHEQVITQMKSKWNKFNYATVIVYVCKFLFSVFYCSGVK